MMFLPDESRMEAPESQKHGFHLTFSSAEMEGKKEMGKLKLLLGDRES